MTRNTSTNGTRYLSNIVPLATVPKVRLYVERAEETGNWSVHVGHVVNRGRRQTSPHAHPGYGQVIFVRSGRGVMNLDGSIVSFEGPCVLLLPAECVHGLDYELDVDRWVVTIEAAYLARVNGKLDEFIQLWSEPRMIPLSDRQDAPMAFHDQIKKLDKEIAARTVGHEVQTEALLTVLLLMLVRGAGLTPLDDDGAKHNEIQLTERFRDLIDQHYWENLSAQDYAAMLAVSLTQLRAACAAAFGQSPTKVIHARLITEAKRGLIFGDTSIEQIALSLGFSNAAYFTRFFSKEIGQTPSQFRAGSRHHAQRSS
jgi:AraC family transcriptional regulator, transcriptional activator of pobA